MWLWEDIGVVMGGYGCGYWEDMGVVVGGYGCGNGGFRWGNGEMEERELFVKEVIVFDFRFFFFFFFCG